MVVSPYYDEYLGDDYKANVATYDDWFPDLYSPIAAVQQGGWISLGGFVDPPTAPSGFTTEVKLDSYMGFVTDYRHVPA